MAENSLESLKNKLAEIEAAISETKKRLPAHSIKPPVMHDLLNLEDERDSLLREINDLAPDGRNDES